MDEIKGYPDGHNIWTVPRKHLDVKKWKEQEHASLNKIYNKILADFNSYVSDATFLVNVYRGRTVDMDLGAGEFSVTEMRLFLFHDEIKEALSINQIEVLEEKIKNSNIKSLFR